MAYPVYSERFLNTRTMNAWTYYTVPAGHRAVITCATATNFGADADEFYLEVAGTTCIRSGLPGPQRTRIWELRMVAYEGELVGVYGNGSNIHMLVSGYLFADP